MCFSLKLQTFTYRYEWVGWKNDSSDFHGPLQITFKFDNVRNFSSVILTCNNYYTKDVRVFKKALVYFSVGGNLYQNQPVKYDFVRDDAMEYARPVMIHLNHHVGKYVRMQLYFDAKWMMISEVEFQSGKGGFNTFSWQIFFQMISRLSPWMPMRMHSQWLWKESVSVLL